MAETTKIQWCDHTFNGWRGCAHALLPDGTPHPGCTHCYAETMSKRNPATLGTWGGDHRMPLVDGESEGSRVRGVDSYWRQPLRWNAAAHKAAVRARVFALSLGDVFEDWQGRIHTPNGSVWGHGGTAQFINGTMDDLRRDLFTLIDATPWLDWLLLTKRQQNVRKMWPEKRGMEPIFPGAPGLLGTPLPCVIRNAHRSNVWLLTSVSDQNSADQLAPMLLQCRDLVPILGLSIEPLLGAIEVPGLCFHSSHDPNQFDHRQCAPTIDWVIVGGESGPGARPCDVGAIRSIVQQCGDAALACFVKQLGSKPLYTHPTRFAKVEMSLKDSKGGNPDEWPEDLRVRQFPKVQVQA